MVSLERFIEVDTDLVSALECVLFVAEGPVSLNDLCTVTCAKEEDVRIALQELGERLQRNTGLQLLRIAGGYQICTKKEYADVVARFLNPQKRRLGRAALEVLAIVAYKQPITLQEVSIIRGVQSDYAIKQLQEKELIEEVGRKTTPGRPILYGTTKTFLHQFGLNDLSELPKLEGDEQIEEIH